MQKIDLLKMAEMPVNETELHQAISTNFPAWIGSKPRSFKRGTCSSALHIQMPCEGCRAPVTKTLWEVRSALKENYSAARCEDVSCQVQTLKLEQLPPSELALWLIVKARYPKWIGKEPGTFVRGSRHSCLMVEVPCRGCRRPVAQMLGKFAKGLRADSRPPSCGQESCKEELLKLDQMPASELEMYLEVKDKAPRWAGSEPGSFRQSNAKAYLKVEVPCENCQQPVSRTLTTVLNAIQHGRLRMICERACRDQRLVLKQLPAHKIELYHLVAAAFPRWVGNTPGSFRRSDSAAALRIELPCEGCQQPVILTLGEILRSLQKGSRAPTCGQESCQTQILKLDCLPQDEFELWRIVKAESPRWAGSTPGSFKRGNKSGALKFCIPCEACGELVERMLTEVRKATKSRWLTVVCSKACLGLTQRREPRPCKGCGALITLHPSLHYCGSDCPGRKPETLTFVHQPAGADELLSWIREEAPDYLNETGDGLKIYGWRRGLLLQMPCPTCEKIFERDAKKALHSLTTHNSDALYCGRECFDLRRKVETPCKGCGNPLPDESRHKRWYCSKDCRVFVWPKEIPCIHCRTPFMAVSSKALTCSQDCAKASHRRYYPHRPYGPKFLKMRTLVLERDSCCVNCGTEENLHCHHINHVDTDHRAENLIILCDFCHLRHHKKRQLPQLAEMAQSKIAAMPGAWHQHVAAVELEFLDHGDDEKRKRNYQFELWN